METQYHSEVPGNGPDRCGRYRVTTRNWARNQLILFLFIQAWLLFLHLRLSHHPVPGVQILGQAFDLTRESSLPTFWICLLTLGIGFGCFFVSYLLRREGATPMRMRAWFFAGAVFLVFSVDDAIAFHERIASITSLGLVQSLNYPSHPWHVTVAPIFGLGLLLAGIVMWRDIRKLPGLTAMLLLALACYAVAFGLDFREGVVQMESIALQEPAPGSESLPILMLIEEALEMTGTTILLFVVISYLTHLIGEVEFRREKTAAERTPLQQQTAQPAASTTIPGPAPAAASD